MMLRTLLSRFTVSSQKQWRVFGLVLLIMPYGLAMAQNTYNPYEPYNNQYRDYARPGGLDPFNAMPSNRSQNSNFESEMDRMLGGRETQSGKSRDSDRYYNAYRKYDDQFKRLYKPNQDVDKLYNERKTSRESVYFKALREKDPKKKSEMMRAYQRGEDKSDLKDDQKPNDRTSSKAKSKSGSSTTKGGPPSRRSPSTSSSRSSASGRSGLLAPRDEPEEDSDPVRPDSLTDRSGRLSEELRPTAPPRGFGSLRSREELKKSGSTTKPSTSDSRLPGLPGLRP
ncbi:MAG: hypothetical protein DWH73_04135 [Planctomycetota bacterium]|nr:MAG: hypothetical protein DWH73_04135 [Planctomycetota bacterium]